MTSRTAARGLLQIEALGQWVKSCRVLVRIILMLFRFAVGCLFSFSLPLFAESEIRYGRDIRPILADKCFFCHGTDPKTREEDLRLDIREEALASKAFVPGKPERSRLIKLINTTDEDDIMPPRKSHKVLTAAEKQLLSDWIKAGAVYEPHWAYSAPKRDENQSIDRLVERDLEKQKLGFSPPAEPTTLLRRLYFDVIGLPPTPLQVEAFQKAYAADPQAAIPQVIDELLASPHFGERMAIGWLDAVRYADTVGYHGDIERSASPYRDYVIDAFNSDKPFDQFTTEQIAGDLLPNATLSQKVAASYNRLNQISEEGGIQDAEYIAKYQAERVRTTTAAWLGSTLACAECHDHKFDPFTAKDFYSFAAYFSDILEKGAWNGDGKYQEDPAKWVAQGVGFDKFGPFLQVPSPEQAARLAPLERQIADLLKQRDEVAVPDPQALAAWVNEQKARMADKAPYDAPILDETLPDPAVIDAPGLSDASSGPVQSGTHSRKQESAGLVQHIAALKKPVTVHEGDLFYLWVYLDATKPTRALMLQANVAGDWSHRAFWGEAVIPYGKNEAETAGHRVGDLPKAGEWGRLTVPVAALGLAPGAVVGQLACTQFGGLIYWDNVGLVTSDPASRLAHLPAEAAALLSAEILDREKVVRLYLQTTPAYQQLTADLTKMEGERTAILKTAPSVPATISAKPREVRLRNRGDWQDQTGPVVTPATPGFLTQNTNETAASTVPATRLDLAKWMVSADNPLTSRVYVNRLWARLFGTGLTKDTGDFGLQGEYPAHPELLDWLAIEFRENNWSVKHVLRTILLSRTYQQSSTPTTALTETDPSNRKLARQSQLRLPAELIRDNALAVAGVLNPAVGGPSAKPYQPAQYYRHLNFPMREYQQDAGNLVYRRGLYTHWQRTFLHPMLKAFDAPARDECTVERPSSNTPLQALNLLNDPTFTEAARIMAVRLLSEADAEKNLVARAWTLCLSRAATDEEKQILEAFYTEELQRFTATPEDAAKLLLAGSIPAPKELPPTRLAAATSLCRALLNLHETITRY